MTKSWIKDELLRRKEIYRELWRGNAIEKIPVDIRISIPSEYSVREQFVDGDKQLETALSCADATWDLKDLSDAIPAMRPDVGCSCLASAFGAEYYWGDDHEQTPGIKDTMITDLEEQAPSIHIPDPYKDGWLPEGIRRIEMFSQAGEGIIPVSLLDAAGGVNVAADLMGMTGLLMAMKLEPEPLHILLGKIQELFISTIRAGVKAAGGMENITTTDFLDAWFPEGYKGHVSDDISASFGPETYREFSAPYHALIFREFGCGGLHNCGPNPCHAEYTAHEYSPGAIDLSDTYSHDDLPKLRDSLRKKAFIYLTWDGSTDPVAWYNDIMETMAPYVIVVPIFYFKKTDPVEEYSRKLGRVAKEYAKRMDWGWNR